MDELKKAEKAFNDAKTLAAKLLKDLGAPGMIPNSAAYNSIQIKYKAAKDDRDAKEKVYDALKKADDKTKKAEAATAKDKGYVAFEKQDAVDYEIGILEDRVTSAAKRFSGDANDSGKAKEYTDAMNALDDAYSKYEIQGFRFNRIVKIQYGGLVGPVAAAGTPEGIAAQQQGRAVVAPATAPAAVGSVAGFGETKEQALARVALSLTADDRPPADDVPVVKPKTVFSKADVDKKLVELKLSDTPENRKTARQALKAGTPAVEDTSWEPLFKANYPQYNWMFTDLDRTKYADVFTLFKFAQTNEMKNEEFDRRWKGTSFYRELESSQKGRELSAAIGNFTWGSGQLAKFLTKATQFGYEGENLKQQAYKELFSKVDGKYVNDLAIDEVKKSTPYLSLKDIGKQYFWDIADSQIELALSGVPDVVTGVATSRDDLIRKARLYAKGKYAHLSEQIDGGLTMEDLAASYREKAAKLLELDPLTMNFDRDYSEALGSVDRPRVLSMSEWETELRTNDKYKYSFTKQANQDATDIGLAIARAFGKVQ